MINERCADFLTSAYFDFFSSTSILHTLASAADDTMLNDMLNLLAEKKFKCVRVLERVAVNYGVPLVKRGEKPEERDIKSRQENVMDYIQRKICSDIRLYKSLTALEHDPQTKVVLQYVTNICERFAYETKVMLLQLATEERKKIYEVPAKRFMLPFVEGGATGE